MFTMGRGGCEARLRTLRCVREPDHDEEGGHIFVAVEYGSVDEDGSERS